MVLFLQVAEYALERAEKLKGIAKSEQPRPKPTSSATTAPAAVRAVPPLGFQGLNLREAPPPAPASKGGAALTDDEKKVLASTSMINGREYLPFMDEIDLKERFVSKEVNPIDHFYAINQRRSLIRRPLVAVACIATLTEHLVFDSQWFGFGR
jgi:hypothetical protein